MFLCRLIKYDKEDYARIGVMPGYGDADSVKWFEVESNCTLHILNCFEDRNEVMIHKTRRIFFTFIQLSLLYSLILSLIQKQVVVRGCRAHESIIPGPDHGQNKFKWFSMGFKPLEMSKSQEGYLFARIYEWRLNMETGDVKERNLTGTDFSMDFPVINEDFTGVRHKYGYTQVLDSMASSSSGELITRILFSTQLTRQASYLS